MITKLVRPVLLSSSDIDAKLTLYHDGNFNHCELSTNLDKLQYHTNQRLILISLDPDENIGDIYGDRFKDGETVYYSVVGEECIFIKTKYNICRGNFHSENCHKIIAIQDQLSPDLINQLVAEYNNGGMKDFEIVIQEDKSNLCDCYYTKFCKSTQLAPGVKCRDIKHYILKLTNGFVVVVEKYVFGIPNNPNVNGVDYENTPVPDYPIIYIEEEVKALINKAIFDTVGNPMLITSELEINDKWFTKNKKK